MSYSQVIYHDDGSVYSKQWYNEACFGYRPYHREDGPAFVQFYRASGGVDVAIWYIDGFFHREDGPAYISYYADGRYHLMRWYLLGEEYSKSSYDEIISLKRSIVSRDHAILNIRHESKFIRMRCQEVLDGRE